MMMLAGVYSNLGELGWFNTNNRAHEPLRLYTGKIGRGNAIVPNAVALTDDRRSPGAI